MMSVGIAILIKTGNFSAGGLIKFVKGLIICQYCIIYNIIINYAILIAICYYIS